MRGDVWSLRAQLGMISNDLQHEYAPYVTGLEVVLSGYYSSVGTWAHQAFSEDQRQHGAEILDWLGIEALSERRFGALSTGQQRRLLLGRALVNKPANLILDEPTSGLDLSATFQYLDTMRRLMAEQRTLVLVTHHIHEIPPEIGRVVLMKDGGIVADGPKESVLTEENLEALFGTPVRLVSANGWYQAVPG
jgi:iron complex transport system ATP-binding protein